MKTHIVNVSVLNQAIIKTQPLYQWDSGQILKFTDQDIPDGTEIHFSTKYLPQSLLEYIEGNQVKIPQALMEQQFEITAYITIEGEESETTTKQIRIPIMPRPQPSDYVTEQQQEYVDGELAKKLDKSGWQPDKYLGTDAEGNVVEKDVTAGATEEQVQQMNQNTEAIARLQENKAEKWHEHNYAPSYHDHDERYAPKEHEHSQYITEHQDISHKAEADDLEKHVNNSAVHVTEAEKDAWNNKMDADHSHSYSEITDIPEHLQFGVTYTKGDTMLDEMEYRAGQQSVSASSLDFIEGNTYIVKCDGVEYEAVCCYGQFGSAGHSVGNHSLHPSEGYSHENNGLPFLVYTQNQNRGVYVYYPDSRPHTVGLFKTVENIVTIDEKYLPEMDGTANWETLQGKPSTFPPASHNHDERYAPKEHEHSQYLTEHQDISGKLDANKLPEAIDTALAQAKASGEFKGENGIPATHSWNGTTLTVTSASGTSSANLKGDKGDKGDTPQKGTDYYTAADKTEMVNMVLSALPAWTGGSY